MKVRMTMWQWLEAFPAQTATPNDWKRACGDHYAAACPFLLPTGECAEWWPCPHRRPCECEHRIVKHSPDHFVAACRCKDGGCPPVRLRAEDVALLELDWPKLGRAIAKALGCDARKAEFRLSATKQVASFASAALPVVLTIQHDREAFLNVVAGLVAQLRERFILLAPTNRWLDGNSKSLLANAHAGFFDLRSLVELTRSGLRAKKSAGELFSPFLPQSTDGATDDEARRLFALLKEMNPDGKSVTAPPIEVFRLYCLEGMSRNKIADRFGCARSLITLRFKEIEQKLGRHPKALRALSPQFERIEDSLSDPRARRIHRKSAIDERETDERE
jgi:hypothetical protein